VQQLEAFDGRSHRDSHFTFVLSVFAIGLLALAAGLYAWMDAGHGLVQWYWLPLAGGVCLLGLAAYAMANDGASPRVRITVALMILGLFVAALRVNGAAPLLFMCGVVIFMHLLLRPKEALFACLLAMSAPLALMGGSQPSDLHLIVVPRTLASGALALVVMQLLIRRNLAFQGVTRRAASGLEEVIQMLASDLSATQQARDLAERALAAQREADARLDTYTRITTEALQCMSQGLAVIDPDGRIQLHNERQRQLLDLPAELMDSKPLLSDLVAFQARRGDFGPNHELVQGNAASYVQSLGLDPSLPVPPKYVRKTQDGRFLEIASHRTASGYLVRTYSDVSSYQRVSEQMTFALADRDLQLTEARKARQAAEEALLAKEQAESERDEAGRVLISVVEASSQGMLVVDRHGRVLVFNEKLCDMLQMPRSMLERKPHYREMLELQKQRQEFDPAFYASEEYTSELPQNLEDWGKQSIQTYTRQSRDGRHLEVSTQFIAAGYVVRTYSDVSSYVDASLQLQQLVVERDAQLQAAHVAREQAARALQDMLDAQNDRDRASVMLLTSMKTVSYGVLASDADGRISLWNERALELLDLPEDLFNDRPYFSTIVRHQLVRGDFLDDAAVIRDYLESVLEPEERALDPQAVTLAGGGDTSVELQAMPMLHRLTFNAQDPTYPHRPGSDYLKAVPVGSWPTESSRQPTRYTRRAPSGRYLEVTTLPLPYGGVVRTYADVSDYVQSNQQLEESLDQLRMVELQLKAELNRSGEAMDLQARFVAAVSHEIRTPLNGIVGMVELLEQARLEPEHRQQLDDLRTSTRQLRRLTDDILDLARMRDSKFSLEARKFNVWQQVRSCVAAAQAVAKRKGLHVELELRGVDFQAVGDPERFSQILNNLLFNAIKFTARGAVQVSGFWEPSDADPNGIYVHLSVADSGRGIDAAVIAQIFEPFHQGEELVNRNFGGTGLGLALCRELCEAMGGHIQVSSRPGHGSVFSFTVSLLRSGAAEDEPETHPADLDPLAARLEGARILVVDDNRINQKLMLAWLSQAGAAVASAFNGEEAVQLASSQSFDCVLMDMSMPVMNGLQASQAIRQLDKHVDPEVAVRAWVPIIGVTAMARREDRQLCLEAGMNAHLSKPVERVELFKTISRLLNDAAWLKSAGGIYAD
jgi:signal transduction histidine kinase/PAS domain-containing protein/ActR/RegA family two-component response regulator